VGFIRKLPPTLIAAFRATLEELAEADLLIHVVDLTSHNAVEQCDTVEDILNDLNLSEKPRLTAINKIDLMLPAGFKWDEASALKYIARETGIPSPNTVLVSASRRWGFNSLIESINRMLTESSSIRR
jgi:GTP-binding protein HflX